MRSEMSGDSRAERRHAQSERLAMALLWVIAAVAFAMLLSVALRPDIEIEIARVAIEAGAGLAALDYLRTVARMIPAALLASAVATIGRRFFREVSHRRADARALALLVVTFALGPGLLVNGLLKTHSHRPRPRQTIEIVGAGQSYRPFYEFDGGCARNCSFSSGETAAAFWTVTPALLAPAALVTPAVSCALAFGVLVGAMRILAGAHFLSDVAFSALAVLVLIAALRRPLAPRDLSRAPDALRPGRQQ